MGEQCGNIIWCNSSKFFVYNVHGDCHGGYGRRDAWASCGRPPGVFVDKTWGPTEPTDCKDRMAESPIVRHDS